jgi:hypothetical protein
MDGQDRRLRPLPGTWSAKKDDDGHLNPVAAVVDDTVIE